MGSAVTNGCHGLGLTRTVSVLDTPMLETNTEIGDHYPGATATTGKICYTGSFDDLFYSDLILIWGGNPNYTHIPNVHFINEARYNGARVVTITPDYNSSCVHADEWVPVERGNRRRAGARSLAHVMVEEEIFDRDFVVEQTDLPFLVRKDTGLFLRESDLEEGAARMLFYVFDRKTQARWSRRRARPSRSAIDPALEGEYEVETARARSGDAGLRAAAAQARRLHARGRLEDHRHAPGADPQLARALAGAKAASAITQTNFSKYYHGMEMERAMILAFALAGQIGKKGAGIAAFPYLSIAGPDALAVATASCRPSSASRCWG